MLRKSAVEEKVAVIQLAQIIVQRQSGLLTDEEALTAPAAFEIWAANMKYGANQVIQHNGGLFRVVNDIDKSEAHREPGGEGMLAVYRPIAKGQSGTIDDPIDWVYGMDCTKGKYYRYKNKVYLCKGDMIPCVWSPDTAGLWQWELVE